MKKYLNIYKATIINEIQYIPSILIGFVSYVIKIFIFLQLWNYLYSDSSNLIAGLSKNQMIWYVIMTEVIWYGTKNKTLTDQITNDVKSGSIAYSLNKPYSYIIYIIFKHIGEITIKFSLYMLFGILIGLLFIGPISNFQLIFIPLIILIFLLSIIINTLIRITISLLSFYIEDAVPFHWLYDKIILILGTIFPIEVFPKVLQPILSLSPIFVVMYGPAKLVIDFSINSFSKIFVVQLIYTIITTIILKIVYEKGVRKLNVNGG